MFSRSARNHCQVLGQQVFKTIDKSWSISDDILDKFKKIRFTCSNHRSVQLGLNNLKTIIKDQ